MTKKHYHHHMEEATGEPTIIEIGEPYPEELGSDEVNRITKKVADLALAYSKSEGKSVMYCWLDLKEVLDEYEKMVFGE